LPRNPLPPLLESLRLHQWSKNLLLAVPAVVGQVAGSPGVLRTLSIAFLAFSLAASGNYILNDLIDVEADRRHPHKRARPLASGRLPLAWALVAGPLLLLAGLGIAFVLINRAFALMLTCYVVLALAYSKFFRRLLVLDVMALAALYTLRLLAGGAAVDVAVSSWLLVFAMFFFVSMAFAKRMTELDALGSGGRPAEAVAPPPLQPGQPAHHHPDASRAYIADDRAAFAAIGPGSAMLAVLVMALYVSSESVRAHYASPDFLWMLCPLLLYWVLRVWIFTLRGEMHHDPIVFALRDRVSYAVAVAVLAVLYFAAH
jgi:4-hydroxybenzoate polyprenyltransferase